MGTLNFEKTLEESGRESRWNKERVDVDLEDGRKFTRRKSESDPNTYIHTYI